MLLNKWLKGISKKITFKAVILQAAFIGGLILTGVSVPAWAGDSADGKAASRPGQEVGANQMVKDAWIKGKLEGVYLFNEHLSPFAIDTSVENGVVRLSGEVESEIDKELAAEIAKGIDGVREVDNRLQVNAGEAINQERGTAGRDRNADRNGVRERETKSENKFVQWVDDATITAVIKLKLLANDNVSGMDIDVDTQ
jgi:osmotically-inducible protein OsmY